MTIDARTLVANLALRDAADAAAEIRTLRERLARDPRVLSEVRERIPELRHRARRLLDAIEYLEADGNAPLAGNGCCS